MSRSAAAVAVIVLTAAFAGAGDADSPLSLPLLRSSSLVYEGAFLLPAQVSDRNTFSYGGTAIAYNPARNSLFVVGHDWYQLTAEVSIPRLVKSPRLGALGRARLVQPFRDATGGLADRTGGDNNKIGGNTFQGALSGGANNNDPEQTYVPTLLNSWVNFGGGYSTAAYSKDGDGIVYLRGVVKDGAGTIYTLPAGFRPATTFIAGTVSNALFGAFAVSTAGNISMTTGSNAWISMDGISFKAEA